MKQVEYYFDLGSPYSYLGFYQIQKIADKKQAQIIWKPMLLGGVFKATGNNSPMMVPAKAKYSMRDMQRWSEYWNIPIKMNPLFPINTLTLMRLVTAVQLYKPAQFVEITSALFQAMFGTPRNLNDVQEFIAVAIATGLEPEQVKQWLEDDAVKNQLKAVTEEAIEKGVFGAPVWFVNDEMFWGVDHLHFVEQALS